ncbi:FecR domain-containing protein [Planctomycetales bacterium ZRK34]|nr:FecR domain-containing protein [Planctomycetales bacterium ZRK34]
MDDTLRLIDAYLDGSIDDAAMDQLDRRVATDPQTASLFAERSMMHRLILDHELVEQYRASQSGGTSSHHRLTLLGRSWRQLVAGGALAAGILIAVTLLFISSTDHQPVHNAKEQPSGRPVGLMVSSKDVLWISEPVQPGQSLMARQHQIASGALEFQSNNGPTVTVIGPATFEMIDPMHLRLQQGQVHAAVPRIARGFTVEVGMWSVVDLGTVFGVATSQSGASEVYVYDGTVRVSSPATPGRELRSGEALRLQDGVAQSISPGDSQYGQLLADVARLQQRPPTASDALALWLTADHGVETDAQGRVRFWRDTGEANQLVAVQDDEAQRPTWAPIALNGRPAIMLDGKSSMRLPSTVQLGLYESDYEVFFVAHTQSQAIQFLLAGAENGLERFELHLGGDAGVRFIPNGVRSPIGPLRNDNFADIASERVAPGVAHIYTARVTDNVGYVGLDGIESDDRVRHGSRSAFAGELLIGKRSTGALGFHGAIAEVLIYRGRLIDGQRAAVLAYLSQKYGLPVSTTPAPTEKPQTPADETGDTPSRS